MGMLAFQEDEQKPLCRVYFKRLKREGRKPTDMQDIIISIKLSSSEEWILIEGKSCTALLKADSKAGEAFWEFAQQLTGELKALLLVPAKGKLGFDVVPDETQTCEWEYDEDEQRVTNSFFDSLGGEKNKPSQLAKLTLEDMQKPVPSSNPSAPRRNGKN